jgi:glutathione peroxidase
MLRFVAPLIVGVLVVVMQANWAQADDQPQALKFQMKRLDGQEVDLSQYHGKVVMIVNVASKCGLTPQYEQLQALHEKYGDQGLAILGFPCNQFGKQEPGTATEIQEFCSKNYGVSFELFSKVDVNGDDACELYKYLTRLDTEPKGAGDISWNFEKFVLDRDGKVIARFEPRTKPDDQQVLAVVTQALVGKSSN